MFLWWFTRAKLGPARPAKPPPQAGFQYQYVCVLEPPQACTLSQP